METDRIARPDGDPAAIRRRWLCVALIGAWLLCLVPLVDSSSASSEQPGFAAASGGLTASATTQPRWCLHTVDPRLEQPCPTGLRPVPGLIPYCPHETMGLRASVDAPGPRQTEPP